MKERIFPGILGLFLLCAAHRAQGDMGEEGAPQGEGADMGAYEFTPGKGE